MPRDDILQYASNTESRDEYNVSIITTESVLAVTYFDSVGFGEQRGSQCASYWISSYTAETASH